MPSRRALQSPAEKWIEDAAADLRAQQAHAFEAAGMQQSESAMVACAWIDEETMPAKMTKRQQRQRRAHKLAYAQWRIFADAELGEEAAYP